MRLDTARRLSFVGLSFSILIILSGSLGSPLWAQEKPTPPITAEPSPAAKPESATPPVKSPDTEAPAKPGLAEPDTNAPGIQTDATAEMLDIPSRPTAIVHGQAKWDEGFASIMKAQDRIKAALEKAGLKAAGRPITIFTQTDDSGFTYDAMLPLAEEPKGDLQLADDVKLGSSPSGKAIKFQHRGAYADIDSTYDLITAYLDHKDLEARNFFIEEYLTDLKSADDPNLAVDIYVFFK
jgi:effector-binding domain-containing protein